MKRVRLTCDHVITTHGDRVQPIRVDRLRWCGQCATPGWRKITEVLSDRAEQLPNDATDSIPLRPVDSAGPTT